MIPPQQTEMPADWTSFDGSQSILKGVGRNNLWIELLSFDRFIKQFEDVGFPGPSESVNQYINPFPQQLNCVLLPFIWDDQVDHRGDNFVKE